jgi:hypothetical protein
MVVMVSRNSAWRWVSGIVVMIIGAAIAIPLGRYAERDDAPGGVVIACLIFVAGVALAGWIVRERSNHKG